MAILRGACKRWSSQTMLRNCSHTQYHLLHPHHTRTKLRHLTRALCGFGRSSIHTYQPLVLVQRSKVSNRPGVQGAAHSWVGGGRRAGALPRGGCQLAVPRGARWRGAAASPPPPAPGASGASSRDWARPRRPQGPISPRPPALERLPARRAPQRAPPPGLPARHQSHADIAEHVGLGGPERLRR